MESIRPKQTSYIQTSIQKGKAIDLSSCNEINTHSKPQQFASSEKKLSGP